MGTFTDSWTLISQCITVLKKDKELLLFPVFSGIAVIILFISFLFPLIISGFTSSSLSYGLLILFYFCMSFIVIFFNTALIACAKHRLDGNNPTLGYGLSFAFSRIGSIIGWAVISATVGLVLRAISNKTRDNLLGRILVSILGMAWTYLTFFVIPIYAFEKAGLIESIRRSGQLFKKTWGENVVAQFSIGAGFFVLIVALIIGVVISVMVGLPQLVLLFLLAFVLLIVFTSALQGIFVASLYLYATTGKTPSNFDSTLVKKAFRTV